MALLKVLCSSILFYTVKNIGSSFARDCSEDYSYDITSASRGSNGFVVKAVSSSETIAIKYSDADLSKEVEVMEHVAKETKGDNVHNDDCNKAIRSEYCNFVKLLGTCDIDARKSIKMEYLPVILFREISLTHFPAHNVLTYAFRLLQAVETLQCINIVHGDLHTKNVGFTANGALKVFDFGNSYRTENPPNEMTCAADYASPESLLFGEMLERSKSDTWSVGLIICELFSAKQFIDINLLTTYESCERRSSEVTWKSIRYSVCSGRAYYYVARLYRCSGEGSKCAGVYQEIEEKLEKVCKPNVSCISQLKKSLEESAKIFESLAKDEQGRIKEAGAAANKADLIDMLTGLLSFDYTKRMTPQAAKSLKIFNVFNF